MNKEVDCRFCHQKIIPLSKKNKLKNNFYGMRYTGTEKKYILVCPNCKALIGAK